MCARAQFSRGGRGDGGLISGQVRVSSGQTRPRVGRTLPVSGVSQAGFGSIRGVGGQERKRVRVVMGWFSQRSQPSLALLLLAKRGGGLLGLLGVVELRSISRAGNASSLGGCGGWLGRCTLGRCWLALVKPL